MAHGSSIHNSTWNKPGAKEINKSLGKALTSSTWKTINAALWTSNGLGSWQAARTPSKESLDLGFLTHLASYATEHQGKVKCSAFPLPNPDTGHICTAGPRTASCTILPLQQQVTVTPTHKPLQLLQPHAESGLQNNHIFQGFFKNMCHMLNWDPRHLLRKSMGVKGDTRHTSMWQLLEMPGVSLSKQLLPPKNWSYQPEK